MTEISNELKAKLSKAQSVEEIAGLLKADGQDEALAEKIWRELEAARASDGAELSLEELEAVAGGVTSRNWWTEGCAASVEEGSDCWGTDGGCVFHNISYYNFPKSKCPKCGGKCICSVLYHAPGGRYSGDKYRCKTCGEWTEGY